MSYTEVYSSSTTFTIVHARQIASRVATDLKRMQRLFMRSLPTDADIDAYEAEAVHFLKHGFLDSVTYGFTREGKWVAALRYTATKDGQLLQDEDPGGIRPADVSGATFHSYLIMSAAWSAASESQRREFDQGLPFIRSSGNEPGVESGYWSADRGYSAGGRGLGRSTLVRV